MIKFKGLRNNKIGFLRANIFNNYNNKVQMIKK